MFDVLSLISEAITTDEYGREVKTESKRDVYCRVDSISQSEFYNAANTDLRPDYRFTVFFGDYNGEDLCEFNSVRYSVYRTFRSGDYMELYAEKKVGV